MSFVIFPGGEFAFFSVLFSGGHQDHRQEQVGQGQPGEGAERGGGAEAAGPAQHHQALPGERSLEHLDAVGRMIE